MITEFILNRIHCNQCLLFFSGCFQVPKKLPPPCPSPGLSAQRQWYLWDTVREFCPEDSRDILCPRPTEPKPGTEKAVPAASSCSTTVQPTPSTSGKSQPAKRGRGGRKVSHSTEEELVSLPVEQSQETGQSVTKRGRGRGKGRGRACGRGRAV